MNRNPRRSTPRLPAWPGRHGPNAANQLDRAGILMAHSPRAVGQMLGAGGLEVIRQSLAIQASLLAQIRGELPEFLANRCAYCVPKGMRLIIYAESAAWATQLRFHAPNLRLKLHEKGIGFRDIQVRNLLSQQGPAAPPKPNSQCPSANVVETVRDSARYAQDPAIQAALGRLGKTLEAIRRR